MAKKRIQTDNNLKVRLPEITPQQQAAIELLLTGATGRDVAAAVDVDEGTVSRWRNLDANFIAALNAARSVLWYSTQEKLLSLRGQAIERLEQALDSQDEKTAVEVAKFILSQVAQIDTKLNVDKVKLQLKNQHELSMADEIFL